VSDTVTESLGSERQTDTRERVPHENDSPEAGGVDPFDDGVGVVGGGDSRCFGGVASRR
jgi:hypothetical protein